MENKKSKNWSTCYEVVVNNSCNTRCIFCSQKHSSKDSDLWINEKIIYNNILYWFNNEYWMLWFTWWEPLFDKNIINYVKFWKKAWFRFIRVQTNWIMLNNTNFVKKLVDAGVTYFKVSVHSIFPDVHDYLVWMSWAYSKVLEW